MNFEFLTKPVVLATAVITFVAASLYAAVGTPNEFSTTNRSAAETQATVSLQPGKSAASVTSLVGGLEARLAQDPNDAKGWLLLAKSHDHLGDRNAAWAAYARAKELGMGDDALEIKLAANMNQLLQKN